MGGRIYPELTVEELRWLVVGSGGSQVLVEVRLDNGVTGWGEASLAGRADAVCGALAGLRHLVLGQSAWQRGAIWQELHRRQYHEGLAIISHAAAGIDIALYDAIGKTLDVPAYELLGGRHRDRVELFATATSDGTDDIDDRIDALVAEGWRVIRLMDVRPSEREGRFEPLESIRALQEWLPRVRRRAPSSVLGLECHHRFTVPEVVSLLAALPAGTLDFIEEPIRGHSPAAYERLRRQTRIPIAFGEELTDKWQFMPFLSLGLVDHARVDVCNVGGLTEAMKIAAVAECFYVDLMPHNPLGPVATAASAQLGMAIPNFSTLEYRDSPSEHLGLHETTGITIAVVRDGHHLRVPREPGIGVTVDPSRLDVVEPTFEHPKLRRPDGSYTNW